VPPCEFNERQYEFCMNYELQAALGAYLVGGMPVIPSQVDEALSGYDAAYSLRGGVAAYLQFKVSHFSSRAWGGGAATFNLWRGPYLRTRLHRDSSRLHTQHNTLVRLASGPALAFYVAPCFHTASELRGQFAVGAGSGLVDASLFGSLAGVPTIADAAAHSISYPADGSAFRLHSEPSEPFMTETSFRVLLANAEPQTWDEQFFIGLRDNLIDALTAQDVPLPEAPGADGFNSSLAELAFLMDQRLGAVLALFPTL
jgi:hypothetical protein